MNFVALLLCISAALATQAVPVLVASHKLVPGLKSEIQQPNTEHQHAHSVNNMMKKLVTECSSDIYVLVNVPGLTNIDLLANRKADWPSLQKYLHMASSVVGLPWVDGALDLGFLEQYVVRTCKAEAVESYSLDSGIDSYIDTRKRVVRVDTEPLPTEGSERHRALHDVDELIRKILRVSPSPHYTILLTSSELSAVHPVPAEFISASPEFFELFHDVVNDPRREHELERNDHLYGPVDPIWHDHESPIEQYLRRKKADEVHVFDWAHWEKNRALLVTVALMAASIVFMNVFAKTPVDDVYQKRS